MDPTPRMQYDGAHHPITGDAVVRQDSTGFKAAIAAIRHEYGLDHPGLLQLLPAAYGLPRADCERLTRLLSSARREAIEQARPLYVEAAKLAQQIGTTRGLERPAAVVLQAIAIGCLMRSGEHAAAAESAQSPWSGHVDDRLALQSVLDGHRKRTQATSHALTGTQVGAGVVQSQSTLKAD